MFESKFRSDCCVTSGKSSPGPWFHRVCSGVTSSISEGCAEHDCNLLSCRAWTRKCSMCVSHCHQCSSSLDFDLNHPWKPRQVTTPGASVPTRMKCSVNGNALTVGLVEAWAWSTLSKENDDFLQSSTPGKGNRVGSDS